MATGSRPATPTRARSTSSSRARRAPMRPRRSCRCCWCARCAASRSRSNGCTCATGPIDLASWGVFNSVYAYRRSRASSRRPRSRVYPGAGGESTPQLEFLKGAMFSASAPDGLLPLEVELAERLIARLRAALRARQRAGAGASVLDRPRAGHDAGARLARAAGRRRRCAISAPAPRSPKRTSMRRAPDGGRPAAAGTGPGRGR